jgi:hypothetical protein
MPLQLHVFLLLLETVMVQVVMVDVAEDLDLTLRQTLRDIVALVLRRHGLSLRLAVLLRHLLDFREWLDPNGVYHKRKARSDRPASPLALTNTTMNPSLLGPVPRSLPWHNNKNKKKLKNND